MNKVIVFGGSNHNTLGMIRSLGQMGLNVICILHIKGKKEHFIKHSRYVKIVHCVRTPKEGVHVLLNNYCMSEVKNIVLFEGDAIANVMDQYYNEIKGSFVTFNAKGKISYWLDKIKTFSIAKKCGLTLIKTWHIQGVQSIPQEVCFPCLLKGENSTTSTKACMRICHNVEDLKMHLDPLGDYLLQEYIEKEYELDIVGLSYNHGEDVFIPAVVRKIRDEMTRQSGCIRLESIKEYPSIPLKQIKKFVGELQYEGIFSIELLYKSGKYYFLEINLRNDGVGYLYTVAGVNYPWLWVLYARGMLNKTFLSTIVVDKSYLLVSFDDIKNMLEGKVSFFRWIYSLITANAYFVFDLKDPLPFCFSMLIHIRQGLKLIFNKILKRKMSNG